MHSICFLPSGAEYIYDKPAERIRGLQVADLKLRVAEEKPADVQEEATPVTLPTPPHGRLDSPHHQAAAHVGAEGLVPCTLHYLLPQGVRRTCTCSAGSMKQDVFWAIWPESLIAAIPLPRGKERVYRQRWLGLS